MKRLFYALVAIFIVTSCCFSASAVENEITYKVGEVVEFGSYPQTQVTDESTIQALDAIEADTQCYEGYYEGVLRNSSGDMDYKENNNMMYYKDVLYNNEKYRGVKIYSYRPYGTSCLSDKNFSYQDDNGYSLKDWYWFKYEPLKWKVFDSRKGLALCEKVIDSQPFNSSYRTDTDGCFNFSTNIEYANNFGTSTLCKWLNSDFFNTAFTPEEQNLLPMTTVDTCFKDGSCGTNRGAAIDRQVILLTYNQAKKEGTEENGATQIKDEFSNKSYEAFTDYAGIQGSDNRDWWLVTPSTVGYMCTEYVHIAEPIESFGRAGIIMAPINERAVDTSSVGVRPVISLANVLKNNSSEESIGSGLTGKDGGENGSNIIVIIGGAGGALAAIAATSLVVARKRKR